MDVHDVKKRIPRKSIPDDNSFISFPSCFLKDEKRKFPTGAYTNQTVQSSIRKSGSQGTGKESFVSSGNGIPSRREKRPEKSNPASRLAGLSNIRYNGSFPFQYSG
jgi:hypothetical protein